MHRARLVALVVLMLASVLAATALAATVDYAEDMTSCGYAAALRLADGSTLRLRLALSDADKRQGLSGLRETDFAEDEALLMLNFNSNQRAINMGDTWFDIDVFFLDNDIRVVGLQRRLKAHPGRTEPPPIENSQWVFARHIMEMRSGSRYAERIRQGMVLRWTSQPAEKEIERCMAEVWNQQHERAAPER
jgi:uncharacterized membrane protein (UPF0127 family)